MYQFKKTAIALAAAQFAWLASGTAMAQTADAPAAGANVVVVTGQRAALNSAQSIKRDSDEIVDSIVADDIGKLPDRSITEVLQRVVGVTIDRTMSKGDPEHYSVEGSGVTIRGLSYTRSELNGRDSFSANGGRSLNFEDIPPELMAGIDVYKNPSAEQIEGAIGGLVNLRTAMPFDFKGRKVGMSLADTYSELKKGKRQPSGSFMYSDRWKTGFGEIGALVDLAYSQSGNRADTFQVEPYYARTDIVPGKTVWVPKGSAYRTTDFDRTREGIYGALQWKKDSTLSSSLTYFKSKYKMQWDEQAIFSAASPYNIQVANGTYGSNGQLLTGELSDPTDGGISFGADTRAANRISDTTDIAWHTTWRPSSSWQFDTDLQHVGSHSSSFDSTVATGIQLPGEGVSLGGSVPGLTFTDAQRAYMADPNNYYWSFTQEHFDISKAGEWAWKNDAKYTFDNPVLRDVRFGFRLTKADSLTMNSNPSYNWAAVTQPWQVNSTIGSLAYLSRFGNSTQVHSFDNFFNNNTSVPAVVFPNVSLATGYPASYETLHSYGTTLCQEYAAQQGVAPNCAPWTPASFGTDPSGTNDLSERTGAAYTQLRFGFDNLKYPIDGNIGLRYVQTLLSARGYAVFTPTFTAPAAGVVVTGPAVPNIAAFSTANETGNHYHNVLPSLNLRMKYNEKLQFRFAAAMGISKPDYSQLQSYTTLSEGVDYSPVLNGAQTVNSVSLTGTGSGNPQLKPVQSRQVDLSAEWYFAPAGSLTMAVFNKRLKDIIINQSYGYVVNDVQGNPYTFTTTGPVNGASGHARGTEIAYQQYFDFLPDWAKGFGLQANYTYVDSKTDPYQALHSANCSSASGGADNLNLNINGCDTNGATFGNLPLQGLSKNAYNLALLYDKGKVSTRLAYSWRSKSLQAVNVNGTNGTDGRYVDATGATQTIAWALPTYADSFGQLDGSFFYNFTPNLSLGLEAQNLTDAKYRQLMQQSIGMMTRQVIVSGRRFTASLRYSF